MKLTIPTWLTLLRIALIPVLALVFYLPWWWPGDPPLRWTSVTAAAIFALASATDWLDGWIARRWNQYSAFGAFLDPVADKLMVAIALFLIVQGHPSAWMALWAAVIVGREIAVSALREWMAEFGQRSKVKVAFLGKIKTAVQMIAITCLLYAISPARPAPPGPWQANLVFHVGDWMLAVAALLTLWSGFEYLRAAWPMLRAGEGATVDTLPAAGKMPPPTRE